MRIMTTNIWGDYFGNPVSVREDNIYDVYKNYSPDIIGFQEITSGWYTSKLFDRLSDEYYFVGTEIGFNANYVPMAIKKNFELIAKGYEYLENTSDESKGITWAVIKDKTDRNFFGVCNTHFWWRSGDVEHDRVRAQNAKQLCDLMNALKNRFDCPVFAFGDMNCIRSSQVFSVVYAINGVRALFDLAQEKDDVCTLHGDPVADSLGFYHGVKSVLDQSMSIDHIVALGDGFKVLQYRVVTEQYALDATDHSPVFADIEFLP